MSTVSQTQTIVQNNAVNALTKGEAKRIARAAKAKAKAAKPTNGKPRRTVSRKGIRQYSQHNVNAIVRAARGDASTMLRNAAVAALEIYRTERADMAQAIAHGKSMNVVLSHAARVNDAKSKFRGAMAVMRAGNVTDMEVIDAPLIAAATAVLRSFAVTYAIDTKAENRARRIGTFDGEDRKNVRNALVALLEAVKFGEVAKM